MTSSTSAPVLEPIVVTSISPVTPRDLVLDLERYAADLERYRQLVANEVNGYKRSHFRTRVAQCERLIRSTERHMKFLVVNGR